MKAWKNYILVTLPMVRSDLKNSVLVLMETTNSNFRNRCLRIRFSQHILHKSKHILVPQLHICIYIYILAYVFIFTNKFRPGRLRTVDSFYEQDFFMAGILSKCLTSTTVGRPPIRRFNINLFINVFAISFGSWTNQDPSTGIPSGSIIS